MAGCFSASPHSSSCPSSRKKRSSGRGPAYTIPVLTVASRSTKAPPRMDFMLPFSRIRVGGFRELRGEREGAKGPLTQSVCSDQRNLHFEAKALFQPSFPDVRNSQDFSPLVTVHDSQQTATIQAYIGCNYYKDFCHMTAMFFQ